MARGRRAGHVRPAEPQRRCVGCRQPRPQATLLRITAKGPGRALPGRGCYLCRTEACAKAALKTGQIARALRGKAAGTPGGAQHAAGSDLSLALLLEWMDRPAGLTATEGGS